MSSNDTPKRPEDLPETPRISQGPTRRFQISLVTTKGVPDGKANNSRASSVWLSCPWGHNSHAH